MQVRVRSWLAPRSWAARRADRPVTGRITLDGFSIGKYGGLPAYAFKPKATGTFLHTADGTDVIVHLPTRIAPLVLLCTTAWGGCLASLLLMRYWRVVTAIVAHEPPLLWLYSLASIIVPPTVWCLFCLRRARRERQFLLDFLQRVLEAEVKPWS